jgi:hypothetical protein
LVFLAAALRAWRLMCRRCLRCFLDDFMPPLFVPAVVVEELVFCVFVVLAKAAPVLSAMARTRRAAILLFMLFLISLKSLFSTCATG